MDFDVDVEYARDSVKIWTFFEGGAHVVTVSRKDALELAHQINNACFELALHEEEE